MHVTFYTNKKGEEKISVILSAGEASDIVTDANPSVMIELRRRLTADRPTTSAHSNEPVERNDKDLAAVKLLMEQLENLHGVEETDT